MQQLVKVREVYNVYVSGQVRYLDTAVPASCPVQHNYDLLPIENSYFFGDDHQRVSSKTFDDRKCDIMLYDANAGLSLDEIVLKYARKDEVVKSVEYEPQQSETQSGVKTLQETQLLGDALDICNKYRENWNLFTNQKREARLKLNNINEENLENFLNESVPLVAFDVFNFINMFVSVHGFRKSSFPGYEELYKKICNENDVKVRAMDTRKLVMLLEGQIPATAKFKVTHSISPIINSKVTGSSDMDMFKQSRIK